MNRNLFTFGLGTLFGVLLAASIASIAEDQPESAVKKAFTFRAEAGFGKCRASAPDESTWQQRALPHQLQLSDKCWEGGLVWELNHDIFLGAHYINFGQFATYGIANNDPQDKADLRGSISSDHTRPACMGKNGAAVTGLTEDCYYRWNGSGRIDDMLFNVAWYPLHFGELKLGGEVGLDVYRSTWRMVIQPMNYSWQYQYDQRAGWNKAPEFGVGARYQWLNVVYRVHMIPDGAPITPAYRSPIREFKVIASIPFSL